MTAAGGSEDAATLEDAAQFEEDAEELYEHAPAGYISSLPGGSIVRVNATLLSWTGHSREELVGRLRLHDLLAPGARIYYETHYAPLLQMQGSVREIAAEMLCADGGRLPVLLNSTLIRDDAGAPRVVRTTVFNASDRRRYERELLRARADAETRARAALALENVNEAVLLVAADGGIDVINRAAEALFDVSAEAAAGRPAAELVPQWHALVGRIPVGTPGKPVSPALIPFRRDARELWLAAAGVESGEGVVYTFRDVSNELAIEQMRNDMIATVSHELRTPLTGVYGSAQTLLARYDDLDDPVRRQLLQMIVDQGERLTVIVDQILLTSRLDTGKLELTIETFDATGMATAVREALPAGERDRVVVDGGVGLQVAADAGTAAQVLASLVENALKYSTGAVLIGVGFAAGAVRLTVADEGPGIPAGERSRIFEKFYRLDPGQQGGVGGTGLGLYIARQLTERMSGRIGLLPSESGTTVFVDLPAVA
jgi:PAS domain S-box-containing protein